MISNRIKIEKIINGGFGLGRREDGRIVLLRGCLPGEEVSYRITAETKSNLFGQTTEIFRGHAARRNAPCPHYGVCGGCDLQHCDYNAQLEIKRQIVDELLRKTGITSQPTVPSYNEFGYRQRIRLQVGKRELGFLRFRSKEIVGIKGCLLANPRITEALAEAQSQDVFTKLLDNSSEVEFHHNPATDEIVLRFILKRKPRPADRNHAATLIDMCPLLSRIFFAGPGFAQQAYHGNPAAADELELSETFSTADKDDHYTLCWEIGGFSQVNAQQNRNIIDHVLKKAAPTPESTILDLYCGMGNFALPLGFLAASVTGVESQKAAIRAAKNNAFRAGLANLTFHQGKTEEVCSQLLKQKRSFDITIIDPPRQGISEAHKQIHNLSKKKIIYISCDPATLTRDLLIFQDLGCRLAEAQPFDMFPQTHHIETVAILEKD